MFDDITQNDLDPITTDRREYCEDRDFCAGEYSPNQPCRGHNVAYNSYS